MEVVVTGTGRCGTTSAARHFGIPHEQVFRPTGPEAFNRPDSSWMAAPYVDQIELPVIHLVRNPLDVINSFVGLRFFNLSAATPPTAPYVGFARQWCPEPFLLEDPIRVACDFYIRWNRMIGGDIIRIEDLTDIRLNSRPRGGLTWDDIGELEPIGVEYGYR